MRISLMLIFFLLAFNQNTHAQTKDSFELRSIDTYDQDGNVYSVTKIYDHLPTREDSILFFKTADTAISAMILETERKKYPAPVIKKKSIAKKTKPKKRKQ